MIRLARCPTLVGMTAFSPGVALGCSRSSGIVAFSTTQFTGSLRVGQRDTTRMAQKPFPAGLVRSLPGRYTAGHPSLGREGGPMSRATPPPSPLERPADPPEFPYGWRYVTRTRP